jgi:hypothetical protein
VLHSAQCCVRFCVHQRLTDRNSLLLLLPQLRQHCTPVNSKRGCGKLKLHQAAAAAAVGAAAADAPGIGSSSREQRRTGRTGDTVSRNTLFLFQVVDWGMRYYVLEAITQRVLSQSG